MTTVPSFISSLEAASYRKRLRIRPLLRLFGDQVPTVDVLIPCCGESLEIILDTVRAACALDYPKDRYRIILLDDGNSQHLGGQIEILKKTNRNLFYTARGVDVTIHSKAANLNHGLGFVNSLGSSEYVAVVDVDMILMPEFLRALLPQLLDNPSFAMAVQPQSFYNIPDGDPLGQSYGDFWDASLLFKDISDGNICLGTGFIVRRSAVDAIGGIPTHQIQEDFMATLLLWEQSWKVAYAWESLQWGLIPEGYTSQAKQARRWAHGITSIISQVGSLSVEKRLQTSIAILAYALPAVALTFAMLFTPAILISRRPFVASTSAQLPILLTLSSSHLLLTWANGLMIADATRFRTPIWPPYRSPHLAPFRLVGILELLFPTKPKSKHLTSGSTLHGRRERESRASSSLIRRVRFALGEPSSWFQLIVITSTIFGATRHITTTLSLNDINFQHRIHILMVGVAWPPAFVHGMLFIVECWKPLSYLVFPPKIHAREALLCRDPDTKVAYPSEMAKDEGRVRSSQRFSIMVLAYAMFVLAFSWWFNF